MHPQQRHARFNIIVIACALIPSVLTFAVAFPYLGPKRAMAGFAFLGICGLLGFGGLYYRKADNLRGVVMDERDVEIRRRAMAGAWGVGWLFWCLLCMGPWLVVALREGTSGLDQAAVPIAWLPMGYMLSFVVHQLAWSILVLVQYRQGGADDET